MSQVISTRCDWCLRLKESLGEADWHMYGSRDVCDRCHEEGIRGEDV